MPAGPDLPQRAASAGRRGRREPVTRPTFTTDVILWEPGHFGRASHVICPRLVEWYARCPYILEGSRTTIANTLGADEYAQLKKLIANRGLLIRKPSRYIAIAIDLALMWGIVFLALLLLHDSWWSLFLAFPAAFLYGQFGFLAHEATHNQILKGSKTNYALSLFLFNFVLGGSRGWWADKHNAHHAQPNRLGTDPDIEGGPIAITNIQTAGAHGVSRTIMRRQANAIWPLLSLSAIQIRLYSSGFLWGRRARNTAVEAALFVIHQIVYMGGLILILGPGKGVLFALAHQMLLGVYLGSVFLPNHTGMPTLEAGEKMDFLHRQVLTARDMRANCITDFMFGALSCQIEHHLFPTMSRYGLRKAAVIVREFCQEHDISYHETGVWEAYAEVYRHLRTVARSMITAPAAAS
jgi:fatty acid desaturase